MTRVESPEQTAARFVAAWSMTALTDATRGEERASWSAFYLSEAHRGLPYATCRSLVDAAADARRASYGR